MVVCFLLPGGILGNFALRQMLIHRHFFSAWSILEVILEFVYVWPKSATSSPGQDYREATYKQTLAKDASTRYLEITGNSSSYT